MLLFSSAITKEIQNVSITFIKNVGDYFNIFAADNFSFSVRFITPNKTVGEILTILEIHFLISLLTVLLGVLNMYQRDGRGEGTQTVLIVFCQVFFFLRFKYE